MFLSDLTHKNAALEEKLRRLYGLNRAKKIDMGFRAPYVDLLKAFGDPYKKLPPVIHIAGTNGKGSTLAMMRAALEADGYKVHAYTSPHLCAFNERVYLGGKYIDDGALEVLIDKALELNEGRDCTFFEITTAMAFAAFAETPADILLLEVGMGGRLDCTNVVERPLLTIITSIGYDHMEHLGDSLGKIAGEKAGIMKPGVPCVIARQNDEAIREGVMEVFETCARERGVSLFRAGAEWVSESKEGRLRFVGKFGDTAVDKMLPLPNLAGLHQLGNAGAAIAALGIIDNQFPVSNDSLEKGLMHTEWPARLQNMTEFFGDILPQGWELWLDGGHNAAAAQVLSTQADKWREQDAKPLRLIMGMMGHKDPAAFAAPLQGKIETLALTDIPGEPNAMPAAQMAERLGAAPYQDFTDAVRAVTRNSNKPGRILICGSLYLAGHVLKSAHGRAHNKDRDSFTHAA